MKQGQRRLPLVPIVTGIVALLASATPAMATVALPIPQPGTLTLVAVGAVGFVIFAARKLMK